MNENAVFRAFLNSFQLFILLFRGVSDGLQIFHPVDGVGFEIAAFGPLVPAIDIENPLRGRTVGEALTRHFEGFFESLGGIVFNAGGERIAEVAVRIILVRSRGGIPSHADIGIVGDFELGFGLGPVFHISIADLEELGLRDFIKRDVVNPDVGSDGIETEFIDELDGICRDFLDGENGLAPDDGFQVEAIEAGGPGAFAEAVERFAGLLYGAERGQELAQVVDREIGFAVDLPIGGVFEVGVDDVIAHSIETLR